MKFPVDFSKVGRLIRMFVISDLALLGGWGFVEPIFAIFVVESVNNATVATVGIVAAVYWLVKAAVQLPVALFIDKKAGERDDFTVLVLGLTLVGLAAFAYAAIDQIWQLYLVEAVHAVGMAMYSPSWASIFSRHLDKRHEALDWSLDNVGLSLAAGITGLLSGYLATWFGFPIIFIMAGVATLIAAFIIFITPQVVFSKKIHKGRKRIRDKKPLASVDW